MVNAAEILLVVEEGVGGDIPSRVFDDVLHLEGSLTAGEKEARVGRRCPFLVDDVGLFRLGWFVVGSLGLLGLLAIARCGVGCGIFRLLFGGCIGRRARIRA